MIEKYVVGSRVGLGGIARREGLLGLLLVVVISGCESTPQKQDSATKAELAFEAQAGLREDLEKFADFYAQMVEDSAQQIAEASTTREERRASILWRVRAIRIMRAAMDQSDPREVLIDLWAIGERAVRLSGSNATKEAFGEQQPLLQDVASRVRDRIEQLARQYIPEDKFEHSRETIQQYAIKYVKQPEFVEGAPEDFSDDAEGKQILGWLVEVPLAPFATLGKVNQGADSMRDLSVTADRFTDVVADFPASARWQLQLLALTLEETETAETFRTSLQRLSESTAQFAQAAEDMPKRTREETELLLDRLDESQPQIQSTLGEVQKAADAVGNATREVTVANESIGGTLKEVAATAEAVRTTADTVERAAKEIAAIQWKKKRPEGEPPPPDRPPFSFQAVAQSAESVTATTGEVRELLRELRAFTDSEPLRGEITLVRQQVDEAVELSGVELRAVVDHGAWRAAQLLALLFVLMVVYRVISGRLGGGGARPAMG